MTTYRMPWLEDPLETINYQSKTLTDQASKKAGSFGPAFNVA